MSWITGGRSDEIIGNYSGPWFSTQLILSLSIGLSSFLVFCFLRTRWHLVYMPRTRLKDFSPASAHSPDSQEATGLRKFFGWIIPTLRTSDFVVLQTVGLDATVLLNFFGMSAGLFAIFSTISIIEVLVTLAIEPVRSTVPKTPGPPNSTIIFTGHPNVNVTAPPTFFDIVANPKPPGGVYLLFTYIFTALTLSFLHRNFHRFVTARQAFALELIHSVASRTVIVTEIPAHLRGERALAEYFEGCGWKVESVSMCRNVVAVKRALEQRTEALVQLEHAWTQWVGNPAQANGYSPDIYRKGKGVRTNEQPLVPGLESSNGSDAENIRQRYSIITSSGKRPTIRPRLFGAKVDAIEYWENKFNSADDKVRQLRKESQFDASHAGFVTFEDAKDAQAASQVVHYREHSKVVTQQAPEPRDVIWNRVSMPRQEAVARDFIVMGLMIVVMLFFTLPTNYTFASLVSVEQIKKYMPWLYRLIKKDDRILSFVTNTIPSLLVVSFNSVLPFLLEYLSYMQGFKSRSGVEFSLMRKYYLFLLFSVLFIFMVATQWAELVQKLSKNPTKIPEKLAKALQASNTRNFMVSYIMLQGIGLTPLKFLNLGPLFFLAWNRVWAKTPRDFAEANAPPQINYGWVYPQALLVFTIALIYSVESPLILIFASLYFALNYLVFKYKLLFIYFKPFESRGEAWGITFRRVLWALILFQTFVTGLFSLRKLFHLTVFMLPLLAYTMWWGYTMMNDFTPLGEHTALSSICDVQRGEEMEGVLGVADDPASRSQSELNHRRYAVNDETLYVAPTSKYTDYSQPPMNIFYNGILNTGRRRYGEPALSGKLPEPWLPTPAREPAFGDGETERRGVVLSLRRKVRKQLRRSQSLAENNGQPRPGAAEETENALNLGREELHIRESSRSSNTSTPSNPWARPSDPPVLRQTNFEWRSDRMHLPDEHAWEATDDDEDDEETPSAGDEAPASPSEYFHRRNRRRTLSGGTA